MPKLAVLFAIVVWLALGAPTPLATAQPGELREIRARAVIEALASGDAATFERVAQENYTDALFARRTAEERAQFVRAIANDFGAMRIDEVTVEPASVTLEVAAAHGPMRGVFVFSFDAAADQRITRLDIRAEAGGGPGGGAPPHTSAARRREHERDADGRCSRWLDRAFRRT